MFATNKFLSSFGFSCLFIGLLGLTTQATGQVNQGQPVNTRIQLPVFSFFNVRTVVSAPDGGVMSLGGVSGHSSGATRRGVPGLGFPLVGRPYSQRAMGSASTGSMASLKVKIISNREIDEDLTELGNRRAAVRSLSDPNGSQAVQNKADFITRNIGRSKR